MKLKCVGKCTKIIKKSSSPAFLNIQIGDLIDFYIDMERVGQGRSGSHAAYITCINRRTTLKSKLSFNQIGNVLEKFEFIQVN